VKIHKIGSDIKIAFILLGLSFVMIWIFDIDFLQLLKSNLPVILKIFYLTCFAIVISTIIHFLIPEDLAKKHLKNDSLLNLFYATILGILTPGPVYAIYPIVLELRRKGVSNAILVAYLTGQTIIGPARAPFEIGFFGVKFYLFRIFLAMLMGPLAGMIFIALSRVWPDRPFSQK
jgi:uncharacterized membrane protein YraQ (UPF0718 family)